MRKPISLFEAALPLLSMLLCLVLGGFFIPMGTELLVLVMLIAATVAVTGLSADMFTGKSAS